MDFGSILEGSGRVLGGFSEGLECFWMDFGRLWERFWTCLALFQIIWPCWGIFSKLDPRVDPRSVTMRGGPPPAWLDRTVNGRIMVV